jgi:hypothetical protein
LGCILIALVKRLKWQAGAGIGISLASLPAQAEHAAMPAALAYAPLWLAMRRVRQLKHMGDAH